MKVVTRIHHALPLSPDVHGALNNLDVALVQALKAAKEAGLPQGLIVAVLHGHAHSETAKMVGV